MYNMCMPNKFHDLIVVGSGPAGLAVAQAARQEGMDVLCIAPTPRKPWTQRLCAFETELPQGLPFARRWARSRVYLPGERFLNRSYVQLDNLSLQAQLSEGLRFAEEAATEVVHGSETSLVGTHRARLVVDASGSDPVLLRVPRKPPSGVQSAWGCVIHCKHGMDPGTANFMDFRDAAAEHPTFAYVLPLSEDALFVEETSLIARDPLPLPLLKARLERRLASLGLQGLRSENEHVYIPMGTPLPAPQRTVGFGAAAGFVHPATGYSVSTSLRLAPALAKVLAQPGKPEQISAEAWELIWPEDARRGRRLHAWGARTLLSLDGPGLQRFFGQFFELPGPLWSRYLNPVASPVEPMLRLFGQADLSMRWTLVSGFLGAA